MISTMPCSCVRARMKRSICEKYFLYPPALQSPGGYFFDVRGCPGWHAGVLRIQSPLWAFMPPYFVFFGPWMTDIDIFGLSKPISSSGFDALPSCCLHTHQRLYILNNVFTPCRNAFRSLIIPTMIIFFPKTPLDDVIANEVKQSHGFQVFDIMRLLRHALPRNDSSGAPPWLCSFCS